MEKDGFQFNICHKIVEKHFFQVLINILTSSIPNLHNRLTVCKYKLCIKHKSLLSCAAFLTKQN